MHPFGNINIDEILKQHGFTSSFTFEKPETCEFELKLGNTIIKKGKVQAPIIKHQFIMLVQQEIDFKQPMKLTLATKEEINEKEYPVSICFATNSYVKAFPDEFNE